MLRKSI